MRIMFWLSGVVLGTLLSTVGMADYIQSHPESVLGRWVHPPVPYEPVSEADFAPPPVAGDVPETIDEPPAKEPELPAATPPPAKNDEPDEDDDFVIVGDPLLPPVVPPANGAVELFVLPFAFDADDELDAWEDFFEMYVETVASAAPKIELLPVLPAEVDPNDAVKPVEAKTTAVDEAGDDDCDAVVYPFAAEMAGRVYSWIQGCIAETIALFGPEDEEAAVELASMDAPEPAKNNVELSLRVEVEAGRFAVEVKCGPKDKAAPSAKPPAIRKTHRADEDSEPMELSTDPEAIPLPAGPVSTGAETADDGQDTMDCPPGHEAICPCCGKWFACNQPTAGDEPADAHSSADGVPDDCGDMGCLDVDDFDSTSSEDELIDDLVFHIELDVL